MRTTIAVGLPAPHMLLAEFHIVPGAGRQCTGAFEVGRSQNQKTPEFVLVEVPDCVDEVPVESHDRSGDLERSKQPGGSPAVGQRPPEGRGHPIGMLSTHQVAGTRLDTLANVIEPNGSFAVVVGHY